MRKEKVVENYYSETASKGNTVAKSITNFKNSVTIYAEFKGSNTSGTKFHTFITNHESAGVGLFLDPSNKVTFQMYSLENNEYYSIGSYDFNPDIINRVAGTFDGNEMKLYINGDLKASKSLNGNVKPSPYAVIVGNPSGISSRHDILNGEEIYRVGIFDGVLTVEEIESLQYK